MGDASQSPDEYVTPFSATTGMPFTLVRRNMKKIHAALAEMEQVIAGLTRKIPYDVLDRGFGAGLSFFPRTESLGIVLPSNSPGVHSLWTPAFALKIPLVLKPGSAEPWTPYRLIQALIRAGAPAAAFSYYPADHAGGAEILRQCGRGMVFGDVGSTKIWANDPRVEVHGPGFSKVVIGEDCADEWEKYLDVMVASIAANSGRSCVNASGVWTPRHESRDCGSAGWRLAKIVPRAAEDPEAELSPFADGRSRIADFPKMIDGDLLTPGARDVSLGYFGVRTDAWCGTGRHTCCRRLSSVPVDHPLANREYLFPFASVVEFPQSSGAGGVGAVA